MDDRRDRNKSKGCGLIGNFTALLGLLVLGYPLAPATIRTMLLGWVTIVVTVMPFISGQFQARQSLVVMGRHSNALLRDRERIEMGTVRGQK